jgi:uncharacterized protein
MRGLMLAGALLALSGPLAAEAQESAAEFAATTLDLSAEGRAEVTPDLATIQVGVHAEAPTASAALADQRRRMTAVIATLKAQGLADRDIQTSDLNLSPQYQDDGKSPRRLTGYQASNSVSVRVRDIARTGGVVDALVASGANEIDGVGFGLSDPSAAEDEARRAALKALAAKAELYATASGYHIRRLVRLSEGGGYQPTAPRALMVTALRKSATPVAAGALTVEISVSAVYELTR